MYTNERQRIRYALEQMNDPIFDAMQSWIADKETEATLDLLFEEIENYMRLHQAKDAKKELLTIRMKNNENVSKYYHRIFKL
jgi:hypothetical protein